MCGLSTKLIEPHEVDAGRPPLRVGGRRREDDFKQLSVLGTSELDTTAMSLERPAKRFVLNPCAAHEGIEPRSKDASMVIPAA